MNKNEKPTLEYRVIAGKSPKDRTKVVLRAQVVNTETYDTARVIKKGMEMGKIPGTGYFQNFGIINGFLETVQSLGKEGRDILLNRWLRIYSALRGPIDPETRLISDKNELHTCACVQADLRRNANDFSWTCVDSSSNRATVQHLQSEGSPNDREIFANAKITASGAHLNYTAATDKITAAWDETNAETGEVVHKTLDIVPEKSGYANIVMAWPTGLTAPVGTEVTFQFLLKGGNAEASVIPATIRAKVVNAPNA